MAEPRKETIIVLHGTWAAPKAGELQWWQPIDDDGASESFITKLNTKLKQRGSAARCWAHCNDGSDSFHWSGENYWVDRARASYAFKNYLQKLQSDGWICHIVAHSHGGNVLVDALSYHYEEFVAPSGKLVTMGTPFLDVMPPIVRRSEFVLKAINTMAFIVSLIVFIALSYLYYDDFTSHYFDIVIFLSQWDDLGFLLLWVVSLFSMAFILRRSFQKSLLANSRSARPDVNKRWKLLAISSSMDEAWQAIHHVRSTESPLSVKKSMLDYVVGVMSADHKVKSEISRIHGALGYADVGNFGKALLFVSHVVTAITVFFTAYFLYLAMLIDLYDLNWGPLVFWYELLVVFPLFLSLFFATISATISGKNFLSAYWSPFRWCALWVGSVKSSVAAAVTYVVRGKTWPLLQSLALGLEGYRYRLPQVERNPTHFNAAEVIYEDLPAVVEARALSSRSDWVARHLASVSKTFSTISVTSADINTLLQLISLDQSLVHGSYYTDDACIERIADWIADDR